MGDVTPSVLLITPKTVNLEVEGMMLTTTFEVETCCNLQCFVVAFSNTYVCTYVNSLVFMYTVMYITQLNLILVCLVTNVIAIAM